MITGELSCVHCGRRNSYELAGRPDPEGTVRSSVTMRCYRCKRGTVTRVSGWAAAAAVLGEPGRAA
jgi:hypothetical protein